MSTCCLRGYGCVDPLEELDSHPAVVERSSRVLCVIDHVILLAQDDVSRV
jgi:hypothetical protein